jgi:hypothetical protein
LNWTTAPRGLAALAALTLAALGVATSTANQGCIYDSSLIAQEQSQGSQVTPTTCPTGDAGMSAEIPPRPAMSDPSIYSGLSLVFAMQSVDVGVGVGPDGGLTTKDGGLVPATNPQPHIGFDLDDACTCCPGGTTSCVQASTGDCDDDAGRDNTGIKLFRTLEGTGQMGNEAVDQALASGLYGIVIQMTGYNGQLNDRDVTVNVFASNGIVLAGGAVPLHNGTDKWTVDPRYVNSGNTIVGTDCELDNGNNCPATYSDPSAYVTCGVLVAHPPPAVPFTFGGRAAFGGTEMLLQESAIVGTLQPTTVETTSGGTSPGWKIVNGSVSGRWLSQDLLSNMATIPDPMSDSGAFICGDDNIYKVLKPFVCGLQDIMSASGSDNMGLDCNSISMAFGFTAEPALLGVVAPIPQQPAGCGGPDGGLFFDTCTGL